MARTIFRKLDIGFHTLRMNGVPQEDRRYELMQRLSDYIYSGAYSSHRFKDFILHNWNVENDILADKLGITVGRLRAIRSELSTGAIKRVGEGIVDDILSNDEKRMLKAEKVLDTVELECNVMFPVEILKYVKDKTSGIEADKSIQLKDCVKEAKFLQKHSMFAIKNELVDLDMNKMAYLLDILDYSGNSVDRAKLVNKIIPLDEL